MPVERAAAESSGPLISVTGVNFSYGPHIVLDDISFEAFPGDYIGIIGPNGSGKSTLLKLILGVLRPTSGAITLFGQPIDRLADRSRIGYVPQRITQADIHFPATVEEVVETGRAVKAGLFRSLSDEDRTAINKAMKLTGVTALRDRQIGNLSGGERQRVYIARSLASNPEILILDEPTVGVDLTSQEDFYTLLCELNTKHHLTILLVSHDVDVVAQEVKNVLFLNRKVIAYGTPKELLKEGNLEKLYSGSMKLIAHKH